MDSKTRSSCRLDQTAAVILAVQVGVGVTRQVMEVSYFAATVEWLPPGGKCSIEKSAALRHIRCLVISGGCGASLTAEPQRWHSSVGDHVMNVSAFTSASVSCWTK